MKKHMLPKQNDEKRDKRIETKSRPELNHEIRQVDRCILYF
jgi:hypothetical protein